MDRETLKKRINALRSKTQARGCTEAEAVAAAEKAAALMAAHSLLEIELEITREKARVKTQGRTPRDRIVPAVARVTNTAPLYVTDVWSGKTEVAFFGREPGPTIAVYLLAVCNRAIDTEIDLFKASAFYRRRRSVATRRAAVADFTAGLVQRLSGRLLILFDDTLSDTALVEAGAARDASSPDLKPLIQPKKEVRYVNAHDAGWDAGGKATLAHGMSSGAAPAQLMGGK